MSHGKFGTAINCMDGRTQDPVSKWMKTKYGLDYVDTITEPGPDKIIADGIQPNLDSIKTRLLISVEKHGSKVVAIVAHDECAGNPVSKEEHLAHVKKSAEVVRAWGLGLEVVTVWVNNKWELEEV